MGLKTLIFHSFFGLHIIVKKNMEFSIFFHNLRRKNVEKKKKQRKIHYFSDG